jgi:acyl-coenzyme A synthetase/AMP-(fatty) acid ligase
MTATWLPLLAGHGQDTVLAWQQGRPIHTGQFLADVQALAARLPAEGALVNLCADRYRFTLGLCAALVRGHTSLLPPNALPDTLARLRSEQPTLYALSDEPALQLGELPVIHCDAQGLLPSSDASLPRVPVAQIAATLLTSGSTGVPQPHSKTWGQLVLNIQAEANRLADYLAEHLAEHRPLNKAPSGGPLAGLNLVATVPAQHSYGFESSVLLALLSGAAFDSARPYFPADIAAALARLPRPRALVTTPFHLKTLLAAGLELPPVDLVLCATAPLSPQLAQQSEALLQGPLIEIYGCTEAGQVATRRTARSAQWHTFGELRISRQGGPGDAENDTKNDTKNDTEQYLVQGGHVAQPTPLSDVLELDDAQHFRLLGRANDLINVAGKRSSLAHLNYHLNSIPGVADGAFWLPDDQADAVVRPVAFVVAPGVPSSAIVRALRQRIEAVFVPRRVVHVAALPREATGKLTAQRLRAFAQTQLAGAEGA